MRKFGLPLDGLRSCDVVTADGEFVVASEQENPELFWGLRGGGGNFGVVTSFTFKLHPLGPTVLAGSVGWSMDDAPAVLRFLRELIADAPDEVGLLANLRLAPAVPVVPEDLWGKPIVALVSTYARTDRGGPRPRWRRSGSYPARLRCPRGEALRGTPEGVQRGVPA